MTLCIAAFAKEINAGDSLVCCFDKRVETEMAGSETGVKFRQLGRGAGAMLAGSVSRAEQFLKALEHHFNWERRQIGESFVDELRPVVYEFRRKLVNDYVQSVLSIDYDELLRNGATYVPETMRSAVFEEITRIDLGCEFIVMTAPGTTLGIEVCTIHKDGTIIPQTNFCAIGTGSPNAESWLHFRQQNSVDSVERTLYHSYEAKRFSESAPGVGKQTMAIIITSEKEQNTKVLHSDKFGLIEHLWSKYGPQDSSALEIETTVIDDEARLLSWHWGKGLTEPREEEQEDAELSD